MITGRRVVLVEEEEEGLKVVLVAGTLIIVGGR